MAKDQTSSFSFSWMFDIILCVIYHAAAAPFARMDVAVRCSLLTVQYAADDSSMCTCKSAVHWQLGSATTLL